MLFVNKRHRTPIFRSRQMQPQQHVYTYHRHSRPSQLHCISETKMIQKITQYIALSLLIVILTVSALVDAAPLLPSQDPFYLPPSNLNATKPGAILRSRKLSVSLTNVTLQATYQFLYRTTNSLGYPAAAVITLLIPSNANYSLHLAYQTAYNEASKSTQACMDPIT